MTDQNNWRIPHKTTRQNQQDTDVSFEHNNRFDSISDSSSVNMEFIDNDHTQTNNSSNNENNKEVRAHRKKETRPPLIYVTTDSIRNLLTIIKQKKINKYNCKEYLRERL